MEHWTEYTRFITALFVILNPFAAVPIYLVLTKSYSAIERLRIVTITAITVFLFLVIASLTGETILHTMGTSLSSFRVGGGIVLLLMALTMLQGQSDSIRTTPAEQAVAEDKDSIAVVPLAIPLLAGPGALSNVIIEMHRSDAQYHVISVVLSIGIVCFLIWIVLRMALKIGKMLGPIGLKIINRLFGLILAAIAVEIMSNGLLQLFPGLA